MPLYEYKCGSGHKFESIKRISDRYDALCPICECPAQLQMSPWGLAVSTAYGIIMHENGDIVSKTKVTNDIPDRSEEVIRGAKI